jgi:hypothetical protein
MMVQKSLAAMLLAWNTAARVFHDHEATQASNTIHNMQGSGLGHSLLQQTRPRK